CLHLATHGPVLVDADVSDALEPDESSLRVLGLGVPPAAVAILRPFHGVEPAAPFEARVAGGASGLDSVEERGERLVQAAQGGLLGGKRPAALPCEVLAPDVFQVGGLVAVPDAYARSGVGGAAVLQSGVVELPVVFQARRQRHRLLDGGAQQELERPAHTPPPSRSVTTTPQYRLALTKPGRTTEMRGPDRSRHGLGGLPAHDPLAA